MLQVLHARHTKLLAPTVALQGQVAQAEQRLAQQQHVYDTIRAERNATAKQLLDLRDDIANMRRKFKSMVCGDNWSPP